MSTVPRCLRLSGWGILRFSTPRGLHGRLNSPVSRRLPRPLSRRFSNRKLVQAADLIGQLGDPFYPNKANALYRELEEAGKGRQLGYSCPVDLVENYPQFYWSYVSSRIAEGKKYLGLTGSGRQWIANLNHHLYRSEHFTRSIDVATATFELPAIWTGRGPRKPSTGRKVARKICGLTVKPRQSAHHE